jgi:hypothetical protein
VRVRVDDVATSFSSSRLSSASDCHVDQKNKKACKTLLWLTVTPLDKTKMFKSTVLSVLLLSLASESNAFVQESGARRHQPSPPTRLSVTNDVTEKHERVPYEIARGDGSTGGGGLPMPSSLQNEDALVRPKVSFWVS